MHHCACFLRTDRSEQSSLIAEFSPVTGQFCLMVSEGLRRHYIMHVSLLHLNRLLKDDIKFKTEFRVRLVDDEDLAQVEFRNTSIHTDRMRLLCKFHLTLPSRKMPRAVSITYHFKLEYFICSNLLIIILGRLFNGI